MLLLFIYLFIYSFTYIIRYYKVQLIQIKDKITEFLHIWRILQKKFFGILKYGNSWHFKNTL